MPIKATVEDIEQAPNLDDYLREQSLSFLQLMGTGAWKCKRDGCNQVWIDYGGRVQQEYCSQACKQAVYRERLDSGSVNIEKTGRNKYKITLIEDNPSQD